jgi:serine/threonine protein phosphatase 1
MRYYAIGDIHGRADLLAELHRLIVQDLRTYSGESTLVYLGDYVDRGADTKGVLEQLISSTIGTTRVFLKGNHEEMLLEFLARPRKAQRWLAMGGVEAARSYGVSGTEPRRVADDLAVSMPRAHLDFLYGLQVSYPTDQFFFCHAGVRPGVALAKQNALDLMWIKGDFLNSDEQFEKIVVHGHSPVDEVDIRPNRINVDTRAYASGRLSCVVLEGSSVRVIATKPKITLRVRVKAWLRDWLAA